MSTINSSTGLVSGLNIGSLVDVLINASRGGARRLESRLAGVQTTQAGLKELQANLLSLKASSQRLADRNTFRGFTVSNSDANQLLATPRAGATAGTSSLQVLRRSSSYTAVSRGFANAETQKVGAGTLTVSAANTLQQPARLELLNGGAGVRRGVIRITDRSGAAAEVDLRSAVTVADVAKAISDQAGIAVRAEAVQDRLVVVDESGSTSGSLIIADVNNGKAATDLGIAGTASGNTFTGSSIHSTTRDFALDQLDDGNKATLGAGDDLKFSLQDGTTLTVDLDGAATVGDVLDRINAATGNSGKLTASLSNDRLSLVDSTTGSNALTVENLTDSSATRLLGLEGVSPSGSQITGKRLTGGIDSVLLRNLRGGQGITTLGSIELTDRSGGTATVDLTAAETLDDVLAGVNNAGLQIRASLDANGNGIVLSDLSGSTASPLIVADVGGGSVATELGIAVNANQTSVSSGHLKLRRVNETTTTTSFSARSGTAPSGSFQITDSAGNVAVVNITSTVRTLGDVIKRINTVGGAFAVTAQLNETGDGIALVDNAGGTGTLAVTESGGKTASDLRLTGTATTGVDGKQRISARLATTVDITADDTLTTLSSKINSAGGSLRASVINSGSPLNPFRLSLRSTANGRESQAAVEDVGSGLGIEAQTLGEDAVLRYGADPATAFLHTSSTNTFVGAVPGVDVSAVSVGTNPATVTLTADADKVKTSIQGFVDGFNAFATKASDLTKFDSATGRRGALQGNGSVLRLTVRLQTLIGRSSGTGTVRSLADLGVTLDSTGKAKFDSSKLTDAFKANPDSVTSLLSDTGSGFGAKLSSLLDEFSNLSGNGVFDAQGTALESTANSLATRIAQIDTVLATRKTRLERQFYNMENILGTLQGQQSSLAQLANLAKATSS